MTRPMSRNERRAAFVAAAERMFDTLEAWYDQHPGASFGEVEAEARRQRRVLMWEVLAILINGRETGFAVEAPECPQCGEPTEFENYRPWTVCGLEGDTRLERAYYVCPHGCGETLFPPGRETEITSGSLE